MARLALIAPRSVPTGRVSFGPYSLPAGRSSVEVFFDRLNWPSRGREVFRAGIEISRDGGRTWVPRCEVGAPGGAIRCEDGSTLPYTAVDVVLGEPTGQYLVRGWIETTEALTVGVAVEAGDRRPTRFVRTSSIAVEAADSVATTGASSLTLSSFATVGADRACYVGVSSYGGDCTLTTSVVRGGTETFTEIYDELALPSHVSGHYYIAPATAAANIVVTMAGANERFVVGALALSGVHQTTPVGTHATASGSSTEASVAVSSAVGELVVDTLVKNGVSDSVTPGTGQTQRWLTQSGTSGPATGAGSTEAGAASVTMSWSWTTGGSAGWRIGAVPFQPAAGGGGATPKGVFGLAIHGPLRRVVT